MATVNPAPASTESEIGERRFVIYNVGWQGYEALLELFGDHGPRMNYLRGSVELMSPLVPHGRYSSLIGYMIEALTDELDIPRNALGTTTFKKQAADRGLEPDECYYLGDNAGRIGDHSRVDLDVDPPPDLAVEVEITHSLLDKLGIYAGIGVPEIWRYDGQALGVLLLRPDGTYAPRPRGAPPFPSSRCPRSSGSSVSTIPPTRRVGGGRFGPGSATWFSRSTARRADPDETGIDPTRSPDVPEA